METNKDYTTQFKSVIEKIANAEIDKRGITKYVSAIVQSVNDDGTINVYIPPNLDVVITGLLNKTGESLNANDSVELCAKNGTINNAWVAIKHKTNNSGSSTFDYDDLINKPMVRIVNNDESSPTIIYDLDAGIYYLNGYVKFSKNDTSTTYFNPTIMIVALDEDSKYVQIFEPYGNKLSGYRITESGYVEKTDRGLPPAGTPGQLLAKKSNTNYDTEWVDAIQNNQILWGPDYKYMGANQTINLSQKVSEQKNGIVLVWQAYSDNSPQPWDYNFTFIPKWQPMTNSSRGNCCFLAGSNGDTIGTKYVYIYDDKIVGNDINSNGSTKRNSGITTTNNHWVLTYVIGV